MRVLLVNVPHTAIGSRVPDEHLPPLGLLAVGGPLIDAGHDVTLLDAEFPVARPAEGTSWRARIAGLVSNGPTTSEADLATQIVAHAPEVVLFGHSGSTSAHPTIAAVAKRVHDAMPSVRIVYGGVYPTYHWEDVLRDEPYVDAVVRGEGEVTAVRLLEAFANNSPLHTLTGIAYNDGGKPVATAPAEAIADLDAHRIGWELIDHSRYTYWGDRRAVVVQFSRGCPHLCNYCGQRGFWTRWRHRDPVRLAAEIARLHRDHGVQVFNFADENPTAARKPWKAFLEALIAEKVQVTLVGSTRADDIVRDADILHLYKQAGVARFLMGMESTDEATLALIRKGATIATDREAIRLLRVHGILSMATWVVGFEEDTDRDHLRGLRQLLSYDPDQVQLLYVTPHRWTPFYRIAADRTVVQLDRRKWDYKHQVLSTRHMPPWRVLAWVKGIEVVMQARPRAVARLFHTDPELRHAQRWYTRMGRRVWPYEIGNFLFRDAFAADGPTVGAFYGAPQDQEEKSMRLPRRTTQPVLEYLTGAEPIPLIEGAQPAV